MKPIQLGNARIERIVEFDKWIFSAKDLFPEITAEILDIGKEWLDKRFIEPHSDRLILGVHSYLVRTNSKNILVDTCNGNHRNRPSMPSRHQLNTNYMSNFQKSGIRCEDVDIVLCTHLHPDHCGWNTCLHNGQWIPAFPKAKYLMNVLEFERTRKMYEEERSKDATNDMIEMYADSILPILNQIVLVNHDHVILKEPDLGIWLEDAGGHTPGHVFMHIKGNGGHAVFTGDVIHHPVQLVALHIANASDCDPILAQVVRRRLIDTYVDTGTFILTGHFPGPTAGRLISKAGHLRFQWESEECMKS